MESIGRYHFTTTEIGCIAATVTGCPPDSDCGREVCEMTVTEIWKRVPAIGPLFPGQPAELGTWHPPSEQTLGELVLLFSRPLLQEI